MVQTIKNIVYMKYGKHASEEADSIIKRKLNEFEVTNMVYWGYGGTICHPINQVQAFLENNKRRHEKTYLVLSRANSEWNGIKSKAIFYSKDRVTWKPIPEDINVYGSKYAIVCNTFTPCDIILDLANYRIPLGNSAGRRLSEFINWHINKGCGTIIKHEFDFALPKLVNVSVIAEITDAVFVS